MLRLLLTGAVALLLTSCATTEALSKPRTQAAAATGAVVGAVVGGNVGDKDGENIAIGSAVGAAVGGVLAEATQKPVVQDDAGWK